MIKKLNILFLILLFFISVNIVFAAPPVGNKQQQQAFTDKYFEMKAKGGQEFSDWKGQISNGASNEEAAMLSNLEGGKTAGGKQKTKQELAADEQKLKDMVKSQGFMGDPTDSGPSDWSDYNIQTDADGNVTGFEEKDFKEKDKDGDGEISDEERKEWDKKKKEEYDKNGGAPGEVDTPPDWDDSPHDGVPDADFVRDCWKCKKPQLGECKDGIPGPCDSHACDHNEQCVEHTETYELNSVICHNCLPTEKIVQFCEDHGYTSDPKCNGRCPAILCVPMDVDKKSGKIVPTMQTRERGSTERCYACMKVEKIEYTWIIIIVETPYGRFVLDKNAEGGFKPSSIMALAKVDSSGKIANTFGQLKEAKSFLGAFNAGGGFPGLSTTGKIGMEQLSGLLQSGLNKSGSFGQNCFDDVVSEADKNATAQGTPTSSDIAGKSRSRKKESEVTTKEQMKEADVAGDPSITGPIVACGNEGKNKVLKIYDASGKIVDTITKEMLKSNPGILTEKLGWAQKLSDTYTQITGSSISSYVEKFTGLPIKQIQSYAAQVQNIKSKVDQGVDVLKSKKGKKKEEEVKPIFPNDPLFQEGPKLKKKKLLGILGSSVKPVVDDGYIPGVMGSRKAKEKPDVKDQWGLHEIGFTAWDDPDSAWNVIDANEKNIVVAVVDSGFDFSHLDAPQYIWTNPKEIPNNKIDDDQNGLVDDIHGWNFLDENHDFTDERGHGTFVAGIIAAKYNNGIGIAGINPGAVIMPVKVANENGETDSLNIYRGINYAVDHGAKVINVSLGSPGISKLEIAAINRAHEMGALIVISSGNGNQNIVDFGPAAAKHALVVGQIDFSGERSTVSNWGANLGLVAPGEQIYSLCSKDTKSVLPSIRKEGYYKQDGTSFSAPMVAATASLILAKNPALTNDQVMEIILGSAHDMADVGWDGMTGAGLLNASVALRAEVDQFITVMFTNLRINNDVRDKPVSLDVYGTVQGDFREYYIEAGKGKSPGKFQVVAGPFKDSINAKLIDRINIHEHLRGSKDWVIRLRVVGKDGVERIASTPLEIVE